MTYQSLWLLLFVFVAPPINAMQTKNGFAHLRFGQSIAIDWPVDWESRDEITNKMIVAASSSVIDLMGFDVNWRENKILINSVRRSVDGVRLATLRLSVRRDNTLSQNQMRVIMNEPEADSKEMLDEVVKGVEVKLRDALGYKSYQLIDAGLVKSRGIVCFHLAIDVSPSAPKVEDYRSIHYICPTGEYSVKITATINKSEYKSFRPIVDHVWHSLRIK